MGTQAFHVFFIFLSLRFTFFFSPLSIKNDKTKVIVFVFYCITKKINVEIDIVHLNPRVQETRRLLLVLLILLQRNSIRPFYVHRVPLSLVCSDVRPVFLIYSAVSSHEEGAVGAQQIVRVSVIFCFLVKLARHFKLTREIVDSSDVIQVVVDTD